MIEKSSDLPRKSSENVRKCLCGLQTTFGESGNLRKVFGNLRKIVKRLSLVYSYNKQSNTWLLVDMQFLLVFNFISHLFTALTCEILGWTLEEKFRIYVRPCIILCRCHRFSIELRQKIMDNQYVQSYRRCTNISILSFKTTCTLQTKNWPKETIFFITGYLLLWVLFCGHSHGFVFSFPTVLERAYH